jgi:GntR family transcriptional regulator, vanillate catabolism transcriptional regulator
MEPRDASRTQSAAHRLRQLILEGELRAGDRLIEERLAERLGVSRAPLRIALAQLKYQGMVTSIPGRGFVIRSFSLQEVEDVIYLRGQLEGAAARLAAQRSSGADPLGHLTARVTQLDRAVDDAASELEGNLKRYAKLNDAFHADLFEIAESDVLRDAYKDLVALPFAQPSAFLAYQGERPTLSVPLAFAHRQHQKILNAIKAGDSEAAEALARNHADLARHELRAVVRRGAAIATLPGSALISVADASLCSASPATLFAAGCAGQVLNRSTGSDTHTRRLRT